MTPPFGARADDYATYRQGFPSRLLDRLEHDGVIPPRSRVLDLGTGTGDLAVALARRGHRVTGLDASAKMLTTAQRQADAAGIQVGWLRARAERIPAPSRAFDAVIAGQCWHWFERGVAAAEVLRVLEPGGRLVVAHFDWIVLPGNAVEATFRAVAEAAPWPGRALGSYGLHPLWLDELARAGFTRLESFSFDVSLTYTRDAWRRRVYASAALCDAPAERLARFDAAYDEGVVAVFPEPLDLPHRVFAVIAVAPASTGAHAPLAGEDGPEAPQANGRQAPGPRVLAGGCHCGAIGVEWRTAHAPESLEVRACSCTFCRSHGARTATDPGGHVRFLEHELGTLARYRFATRSAEFLLCTRCGVYLGAFLAHEGRSVATVNVNTLGDRDAFPPSRPVDYGDEPRDARIARRLARWTPAEIVSAAAGTS